jgi:alanine dehydrogenase
MALTVALIHESKIPPDKRVVFSPTMCREVMRQHPDIQILVESSPIRVFTDDEYRKAGIPVVDDVSGADVFLGVKEVRVDALIPNKKYFFFSHTVKKQPYNRKLLQTILKKKIELYDHELITRPNGARLIGFGRYAGLVGAYNGFRALGLRDDLYTLPKAEDLTDYEALKRELEKIALPSDLRIILSGTGKVARGAREILDHLLIREVTDLDFLTREFDEPVYCLIDVTEYYKRSDGQEMDKYEFYDDPSGHESDFLKYARVANMFIAGHYYGDGAPYLFTREDARRPDFKINLVADISCDIDGPVASTIRPSTIAEPFYGYNPHTEEEVAFDAPGAITVMAVDNLPCELPRDASEGFGEMFLRYVIPAFFNGDADGILKRARMTTPNGTLTERYSYLHDYVAE